MSTKKLLIIKEASTAFEISPTSYKNLINWEIITANSLKSLKSLMFDMVLNQPDLIVLVERIAEIKGVEVVRLIRTYLKILSPIILVTTKSFSFQEEVFLNQFIDLEIANNLDCFSQLITNNCISCSYKYCCRNSI